MSARPPGRPPATWYPGTELALVEPGTVVSIDVAGKHRPRLVGRVLRPHPDRTGLVILRDRTASVIEVSAVEVTRFRILDRVFALGRGAWHLPSGSRVMVVNARDADQYLVEDAEGVRRWAFEGDLASNPPKRAALKRGPIAGDPVREDANAGAVAARGWAR